MRHLTTSCDAELQAIWTLPGRVGATFPPPEKVDAIALAVLCIISTKPVCKAGICEIDRRDLKLAEHRTVGPDGVQVQIYARVG